MAAQKDGKVRKSKERGVRRSLAPQRTSPLDGSPQGPAPRQAAIQRGGEKAKFNHKAHVGTASPSTGDFSGWGSPGPYP